MRRFVAVGVARTFWVVSVWSLVGVFGATTGAAEVPDPNPPGLITNLAQLRHWADQHPSAVHPFRIQAKVLDADCAAGVLVLRDASGSEFIRVNHLHSGIRAGETVRFEGDDCTPRPQSFGLAMVSCVVVENDGIHAAKTESGSVFLHAGINPFCVQWFNGGGEVALGLEYQGPGLPRQPVPDSAFSRAVVNPGTGKTNFLPGLDYRCYEGAWEYLSDFGRLHVVKTGVATSLDLDVRTRKENVGLQFNGFITIPRAGRYEFFLSSDDGSRLFVGQPSVKLTVLDNSSTPFKADGSAISSVALLLEATNHSGLSEDASLNTASDHPEQSGMPWLTLEGRVNFAGMREHGGEMQLRVGNDNVRVEIFGGGDSMPELEPGAKVRVSGIYRNAVAEDGSTIPGVFRVPGWNSVQRVPGPEVLSAKADENRNWIIEPAMEGAGSSNSAPVLWTAAEIKALPVEVATREIPVSIRAVVTATLPAIPSVVVQDSTRGIYVSLDNIQDPAPMERGEFYQIDGVTGPGLFSPVITARRITHLGAGELPQPIRATWDQLMNGRLDTEYAEVEGVVTAVRDQSVELLTEGGKIKLEFPDFRPDGLACCENARIRIRGCVFARFDSTTHRLEPGSVAIRGAAVEVLQRPPYDLFDLPRRTIGELLLYDPKSTALRMLKVSGQIVYGGANGYFLTDGTNGMHVTLRNAGSFSVGDWVDAVGFLDLGGPVAELKEAVARKTGHAALPEPMDLVPSHLLIAGSAGNRVRVNATLMNEWREGSNYVLELQSKFVAFKARMGRGDIATRQFEPPPFGSRLQLTGVYAPLGSRSGDGTVSGFELLVNSPGDVRVLVTPPWWTLRRVLVLSGILAALLFGVLIWNKELHLKVQERSRQLEAEIGNRRRAELRHAAEAERSRIARDLHDELGAGLTEVSLLASAGLGEHRNGHGPNDRFAVIGEKARSLVSGLDVIVWAVDPKRDSLQSFADYIGGYAKELLSASNIVCRLRIPIECDAVSLPGPVRHNLFLAVKESLNNIVRHAAATEVELQVTQSDGELEIVISDNGRGFDRSAVRRVNGLLNLEERLKSVRGQCRIESEPAKGTRIKLSVSVSREAHTA